MTTLLPKEVTFRLPHIPLARPLHISYSMSPHTHAQTLAKNLFSDKEVFLEYTKLLKTSNAPLPNTSRAVLFALTLKLKFTQA